MANTQLAKTLTEQGVPQRLAKAATMTHMLSRLKNPTIDTVIRAMDTLTTGEGKDWIQTGFSPDVIQAVALARRVSPLFRRVPMPTSPYVFPVQGGRPTPYLVPENTADTGQTAVPASNAGTANMTFTARKIGSLV